jgi:hypothetical protein
MPHRSMWIYKGTDIHPADRNSSGIRWYARTPWGTLRADSKPSMRILISETMTRNQSRIWVSPNGMRHLVVFNSRCATCGRTHGGN